MTSPYTYLWEFEVRPGCEVEFEKHYGPEGTWAKLFSRAPGYLDTRLLKNRSTSGRYLTVDRWQSEAAYLTFRSTFASEYMGLDNQCQKLTMGERLLGSFGEVTAG
jgi:hypothetical protein